MKYNYERYVNTNFNGDYDNKDVSGYESEIVCCLNNSKCSACNRTIEAGEYVLIEMGYRSISESNKKNNINEISSSMYPISCYTCIDCLDKWIDYIPIELSR